MNARRDVGELLAGQLEAIDPSDLIRQRDSARAWAAEYMRRCDTAERYVADMPCNCGGTRCDRCELTSILLGDLA